MVNAGTYELFLQYQVAAANEGAILKITIGDKTLIKKVGLAYVPSSYPIYGNVDRGRPLEMRWKDFSWGKMELATGIYEVKVQALKIPGQEVGELYGLTIKNTGLPGK